MADACGFEMFDGKKFTEMSADELGRIVKRNGTGTKTFK